MPSHHRGGGRGLLSPRLFIILVGVVSLVLFYSKLPSAGDTHKPLERQIQRSHAALNATAPRFLLFEPWEGNWVDQRSSWEMAIAYAYALERILVLPPRSALVSHPSQGPVAMGDLIDLTDLDLFIPVVTYERWKKWMEDNNGFKHNRTSLGAKHGFKLAEAYADVERVSTFTNPPWSAVWKQVLCIPDVPKSTPQELEEFAAGRPLIGPKDSNLQGTNLLFPSNFFGPFYTAVWFEDKRQARALTNGIRDFFQYNRKIQSHASASLYQLGGIGRYLALHVQGSLDEADVRQLTENVKAQHKGPNEPIFVFTNVHDLNVFEPLKALGVTVFFSAEVMKDVPERLKDAAAQVVCSKARAFIGTRMSTESGYIQRLRGYQGLDEIPIYHSDTQKDSIDAAQIATRTYEWSATKWREELWGREYRQGYSWDAPKRPQNRYLLFTPADGSLNDVRMSWEMAIAYAYATGRTLVIPPKHQFDYVGKSGKASTRLSMLNVMNATNLNDLVPLMSFERWEQMHEAQLNNATFDSRTQPKWPQSGPTADLREIYANVHRVAAIPTWAKTYDRVLCSPECDGGSDLRAFAGGRSFFDDKHEESMNSESVYFAGNLYGVFSASVWFKSAQQRKQVVRGIKQHFGYSDLIRHTAETIVSGLGGKDRFAAIQVDRTSSAARDLSNKDILTNAKTFIDPHLFVYLSANSAAEGSALAQEFKGQVDNKFFSLNDFADLLENVPEHLYEAIDQVVCSLSQYFVGTPKSTTTMYVERLRGYRGLGGYGQKLITQTKLEQNFEDYPFAKKYKDEPHLHEYRLSYEAEDSIEAVDVPVGDETCEEYVLRVANTKTNSPLPINADKQPPYMCDRYWQYLSKYLCTSEPGDGKSKAFSEPQWEDYIERMRPVVERSAVEGKYVFFTLQHLTDRAEADRKVKYNPHAKYSHPDMMLNYANKTAISFERVYGKQPIFIADDNHTKAELEKIGIKNILLDETPWWRTGTVAGNRHTSRSTITKYFFLYFFMRMGMVVTFFDSDGYHLRKVDLKTHAEEVDVVFNMEYQHQVMPHRASTDKTKLSPLVNEFFSTNWFAWCAPNVDHVPINTGYMTWFPTRNNFRLLTNQIDYIRETPEWWEQNLLTYIHYHHTLFGLKVGYWHPGTANRYGVPVPCQGVAPTYVWVHTKITDTYEECRDAVDRYGVPPIADIQPSSITLNLHKPFLKQRGDEE